MTNSADTAQHTPARIPAKVKHLRRLEAITDNLLPESRTDAEREQDKAIEARSMLSEFLAEEL